jgi:hypothetical protein
LIVTRTSGGTGGAMLTSSGVLVDVSVAFGAS